MGRYVPTSPCTFDATFTRATGAITPRPHEFTVLDELGRLHFLKVVTGLHGNPAPEGIRPGTTVTLVMSGVLPTGSAPSGAPTTSRPIVS